MRVRQLAKQEKISPDTLRYYVRIGLLTPKKSDNGYHHFSHEEQKRLRFILSARELGFTIEDITHILEQSNQGLTPCPTVRQLIETRLVDAKLRLLSMQRLVERMENAVDSWKNQPDCTPCGEHICHLIEGDTSAHSSLDQGEDL